MFKNERIGVRLEPQLRQKCEELVEKGNFRNLSELIRTALKQFLDEKYE